MTDLLRIFLPVYFTLYLLVLFVARSYIQYRKTGQTGLVLGSSDSAHDFIGRIFKLLFGLVAAQVVLFGGFPRYYPELLPLVWLENDAARAAGLLLLAGSLVWTFSAQLAMADSWRIGIDFKTKTDLVERGLFRFSRNPIFLGMLFSLLGFFLAIPNALSALVLILGFVLIQIQVRLEEEYLASVHGESYRSYSARVRRWL